MYSHLFKQLRWFLWGITDEEVEMKRWRNEDAEKNIHAWSEVEEKMKLLKMVAKRSYEK